MTYDRSKRTTNGVAIRHDGTDTDWWAFRSACTTNGCAATGTQLDDATHQVASTTDGGQTDTLRFVAGYWQGAPQQERVGCTPAERAGQGHPAGDGRVVVGAASRRHAARHARPRPCSAMSAARRAPWCGCPWWPPGSVTCRPGVTLADPTQVINASTTPAHPAPAVLGGTCSDVDKLAYDPTNNEQVVCEGNTWAKAPITTGVHAAGSSCDRPDTSVFAMSTSNDGYLLQCDPVTPDLDPPLRA